MVKINAIWKLQTYFKAKIIYYFCLFMLGINAFMYAIY